MTEDGRQKTEDGEIRAGALVALHGRAGVSSVRILSEVFGAPTSISEVEFSIRDTVVNVRSRDGAFLVGEGDEIAVIGRRESGKLKAIAWWNCRTKRGSKPSGWYFWPGLFASVILAAGLLGILTAASGAAVQRMVVSLSISLVFVSAVTLSGFYQRRARRLLESAIEPTKSKRRR